MGDGTTSINEHDGCTGVVMSETEIKLVKRELYEAITHFIERQKLVTQAIVDLGLNLEEIGQYGVAAWAADLPSGWAITQSEIEKVPDGHKIYSMRKRVEALRLPGKGVWIDHDGDEWEYFLHGKGCLLTNKRTGEPVDWEYNVLGLSVWFFLRYLEWQLISPEWEDRLVHTRKWIQSKEVDSIYDLRDIWDLIREVEKEYSIQPLVRCRNSLTRCPSSAKEG